MNNLELRHLKFTNTYAFHNATRRFHADAMSLTTSMLKKQRKVLGKK